MSVVRLQGLCMEAGSADIRKFFSGLRIPEGGVHITGGSLGEAFIVFADKKDGKLAIQKSGAFLRGSRVTLSASSETELQQKMISCLKKYDSSEMGPEAELIQSLTAAYKPEVALELLLNLVSAVGRQQEKQPTTPVGMSEIADNHSISPVGDCVSAPPVKSTGRKVSALGSGTRYLCVRGFPSSVTRREICHFFHGLKVQEVIVNTQIRHGYRGCLVKFAGEQDSCEGLKYNGQNMGSFCVKVQEASEDTWFSAVDACRMMYKNQKDAHGEVQLPDRSRSRSPMKYRSSTLSPGHQYCVMVRNLNPRTTKTEIKDLFGCPDIPNNKVLHLLDNWGQRTDTAFVLFDKKQDYISAMDLDRYSFCSRIISVSAISEGEMRSMIKKSKQTPVKTTTTDRAEKPKEEAACMYVRNLPADIRKIELKDFFGKFRISEDCINLLSDNRGVGLGEAVVMFESVESAKMAERQNGRNFLGSPVLLTRISTQQMKDLLNGNH